VRHGPGTAEAVHPAGGVTGEELRIRSYLRAQAAKLCPAEVVRGESRPFLLELRSYRFRAHSMADPELYRERDEVEQWQARDPIAAFMARLKAEGVLANPEIAAVEAEVAAEIEQAAQVAEAGPWEPVEDLTKNVYTP